MATLASESGPCPPQLQPHMAGEEGRFLAGCGRPDRAVVVFSEETRLPKLRRLKPGFRHCLAYLRLETGWIGMDPLSHVWEIRHFPDWDRGADLAAHLRRLGQCALTVPIFRPPARLAPPLPVSCVEAVKRLIGLHSWSVRTPWELFLHLEKICLDDVRSMFYIPCQENENKPPARG